MFCHDRFADHSGGRQTFAISLRSGTLIVGFKSDWAQIYFLRSCIFPYSDIGSHIFEIHASQSRSDVDWRMLQNRGENKIMCEVFSSNLDKLVAKNTRAVKYIEYLPIPWIKNELNGTIRRRRVLCRSFCVRVGSFWFTPRHICSGVPQGSALVPIVFLLHTSDLPNCLTVSIWLFADEIYSIPCENPDHLQRDLLEIQRWCDEWLIPLNPEKRITLHSGANNPRKQYSSNGMTLPSCRVHSDLGVV